MMLCCCHQSTTFVNCTTCEQNTWTYDSLQILLYQCVCTGSIERLTLSLSIYILCTLGYYYMIMAELHLCFPLTVTTVLVLYFVFEHIYGLLWLFGCIISIYLACTWHVSCKYSIMHDACMVLTSISCMY